MTEKELTLIEREIQMEAQGRYALGTDAAGADIRMIPNPLVASAARLLEHVQRQTKEIARLTELVQHAEA